MIRMKLFYCPLTFHISKPSRYPQCRGNDTGSNADRADCQASHNITTIPAESVKLSTTATPNRPRIWAQYTTGPHAPLSNNVGTELFTMPAPTTQKSHVTKIHIACAPTDAIGCLDQVGWMNKAVYAPAVSDVQEEANKSNRTPARASEFG